MSILPRLFHIVLEMSVVAIKQEKEIEGICIYKDETKLSFFFFTNGMMVYVENLKNSTKN